MNSSGVNGSSIIYLRGETESIRGNRQPRVVGELSLPRGLVGACTGPHIGFASIADCGYARGTFECRRHGQARNRPESGGRPRGLHRQIRAGAPAPDSERRTALRRWLPTANELVYDNYNFFVIGYSPTERPSDTIVSLAAGANGVGLSFYRGATLPDPHRRLLGSGTQNRFIRLPAAAVLQDPISKRSSRRRSRNPEDRWQQPVAASW